MSNFKESITLDFRNKIEVYTDKDGDLWLTQSSDSILVYATEIPAFIEAIQKLSNTPKP